MFEFLTYKLYTLPETQSLHPKIDENRVPHKERKISLPPFFMGELLVLGRVLLVAQTTTLPPSIDKNLPAFGNEKNTASHRMMTANCFESPCKNL